MNILFIASDNYYSGAFLSMVTLCNIFMYNFTHNVSVILPHKGTSADLLDKHHIPHKLIRLYSWIIDNNKKIDTMKRIKIAIKKIVNKLSILQLILYMKLHKIDIVHINTSYSYVGAIAARCARISYIWHIREFLEEDQRNRMWNRKEGYSLISKADMVIVISDSIHKKYENLLETDKIVTIFNGIDAQIFSCQKHEILSSDIVKLLIINHITEHKGQEQFIRACAKSGQIYALTHYTAEKNATQINEIYKKIALKHF